MHSHTSEQEKVKLGTGDNTCNIGAHIAALYETKEERDKILFGFITEGLKVGDLQLVCPTEQSIDGLIYNYAHVCPECSSKLNDPNQIAFFSEKDVYYPSGEFLPLELEDILEKLHIETQREGERTIRATQEMAWSRQVIPGVENIFAYESILNRFIKDKPWVIVCFYNTTKFSGSELINVMKTHPYTITDGVLQKSPFYEEPEKWLSKNAPEFLEKKEA